MTGSYESALDSHSNGKYIPVLLLERINTQKERGFGRCGHKGSKGVTTEVLSNIIRGTRNL